jgi:hypothetical protein
LCPGFFTRPTGDLGLPLPPRDDHVETNRPLDMSSLMLAAANADEPRAKLSFTE